MHSQADELGPLGGPPTSKATGRPQTAQLKLAHLPSQGPGNRMPVAQVLGCEGLPPPLTKDHGMEGAEREGQLGWIWLLSLYGSRRSGGCGYMTPAPNTRTNASLF